MKKKDREFEEQKKRELDDRLTSAVLENTKNMVARLKSNLELEMRLKYQAYHFICANGMIEQFKSYCQSCNMQELTGHVVDVELHYINMSV